LGSNLRIGDVSAPQGIILGDDVDYVDSEHQLRALSEEGMNGHLHTTGTVTFLAVESLFKALRLAKRSSALVMLSEETTVAHLGKGEV